MGFCVLFEVDIVRNDVRRFLQDDCPIFVGFGDGTAIGLNIGCQLNCIRRILTITKNMGA